MAKLIVISGDERQEFELGAFNTLGRRPDNTIQILDRIISKEHAQIHRSGDGRYLLRDLRWEFPKVVGGRDDESGIMAYQVYKKFISDLHLVSSGKVAEMIKVMEGCYRDVNIALANELFKICQDLDINFFEAREKANHQFCHIHLPPRGWGATASLSIPGSSSMRRRGRRASFARRAR